MKKKLYLLFGIFLAIIISSCGRTHQYPYKISDFRPELRVQLQKLVTENLLPSKDTAAINFLNKKCTKEELLQILNCENPLLRIIAYRTIVNRKEKDYFKILLNHLNDTAKVTWWYYNDAADVFTISDLMIRKAADNRELTQNEKNILVDSILIKHPYLHVSTWMIQDIQPQEKYYTLIRERAKIKTERCGEQLSACYALSKFKKNEDVKLLEDAFRKSNQVCIVWIFRSIENFPNDNFFPFLQNYYNTKVIGKLTSTNNVNDDLLYFCRAVASYKNDESLKILKYIENHNTYINKPYWPPSNKEYVFKAIYKHKSEKYDRLFNQLKPQIDSLTLSVIDEPEYNEKAMW